MKVKLRIVQLSNGQYRVQLQKRVLLGLFWSPRCKHWDYNHVNDARRCREDWTAVYAPRRVVAVIEERTL